MIMIIFYYFIILTVTPKRVKNICQSIPFLVFYFYDSIVKGKVTLMSIDFFNIFYVFFEIFITPLWKQNKTPMLSGVFVYSIRPGLQSFADFNK